MHNASGLSHVFMIEGGVCAIAAFGQAQTSTSRPEFAAASIRPDPGHGSLYVLAVAKGGLKMKPSADQISPDVSGPAPPGAGPNRGVIRIGLESLIGNAAEMPLFVRFLSQRLGQVVIDKTGLTGRFDFQAQWTPDLGETHDSPTGVPLPPAGDDSGTSVFTALEEQLGLKLESQKGLIETYIIDHVERPSPN